MSAYQETAQQAIREVLGWHGITSPSEIMRLDPDIRRLLKKDLANHCPFQQRGLPFRIWETELRILFGIEARKPEAPVKPVAIQEGLF